MADIELIIKMSEEDYEKVIKYDDLSSHIYKAIQHGTPLKTGHWINAGYYFPGDYENIDYVKCSCCNVDSLEEGDYCPNCGAKMAEGV